MIKRVTWELAKKRHPARPLAFASLGHSPGSITENEKSIVTRDNGVIAYGIGIYACKASAVRPVCGPSAHSGPHGRLS